MHTKGRSVFKRNTTEFTNPLFRGDDETGPFAFLQVTELTKI